MSHLSLYAISINDVRDIFGARPELANRLRAVYDERFRLPPSDPRVKRPLLEMVGPLTRNPPRPRIPADHPLPGDVEALLAGRFIAPERLELSWRVLTAWLEYLSRTHTTIDLGELAIDDVDFDLARAGLPSAYSLGRLLTAPASLPIRVPDDMAVGYFKTAEALAARAALTTIISDVDPRSAGVAGDVLRFGNDFEEQVDGLPDAQAPDLVGVWCSGKQAVPEPTLRKRT